MLLSVSVSNNVPSENWTKRKVDGHRYGLPSKVEAATMVDDARYDRSELRHRRAFYMQVATTGDSSAVDWSGKEGATCVENVKCGFTCHRQENI